MTYENRMRVILEGLGIKPTAHLPLSGADAKVVSLTIRGTVYPAVAVWVAPSPGAQMRFRGATLRKIHSAKHRVRARCPLCARELSAGRLHQHVGTVACLGNLEQTRLF